MMDKQTSFQWTFGKDEVFTLETTVTDVASQDEMTAHVESVIGMLKVVVGKGGHAVKADLEANKRISGNAETRMTKNKPADSEDGETISEDEMKATVLEATVSKGQAYWKVKGKPFTQYGVAIWPEVLSDAGINLDELSPMKVYKLDGTAVYQRKGAKPNKVTKLKARIMA
jgi:hypothetical protein